MVGRTAPGRLLWVLFATLIATGCMSMDAHRAPDVDLQTLRTFHVVHREGDHRNLNEVIAEQLIEMGYEASSGSETDQLDGIDSIVTYSDSWWWDIIFFLAKLDIQLRDPATGQAVAWGNTVRDAATGYSAKKVTRELLEEILVSANERPL